MEDPKEIKFELLTNQFGNNKYYDSRFSLKPTFKPGADGLYRVIITECTFRNNEATLEIGDWISYKSWQYLTEGANDYKILVEEKYTLIKKVFTFDRGNYSEIIKVLTGNPEYVKYEFKVLEYYINNEKFTPEIAIEKNDLTTIKYINLYAPGEIIPSKYTDPQAELKVTYEYPEDKFELKRGEKIKINFSNNFVFLLNEYVYKIDCEIKADLTISHIFNDINLAGSKYYLLDMSPLKATVLTSNENNQRYNIGAKIINMAETHNIPFSGLSSMEMTTNSLTNMRIQLVNDFNEQVKIRTPILISLTVRPN